MTKGVVIDITDIPAGAAVRRRPGRPRKVFPACLDEQSYHQAVAEQRDEHLAQAALVNGGPDALAVMEYLVVEVAREAAALAFDARRAEERGQDAGKTSSRRVDALVRLAGLVLERHRLRSTSDLVPEEQLAQPRAMLLALFDEAVAENLGSAGATFAAEVRRRIEATSTSAATPG